METDPHCSHIRYLCLPPCITLPEYQLSQDLGSPCPVGLLQQFKGHQVGRGFGRLPSSQVALPAILVSALALKTSMRDSSSY